MKSTTYIVEMNTQKNGKYLSEEINPLACLPACLLASGQLINFLCEFTEKFKWLQRDSNPEPLSS